VYLKRLTILDQDFSGKMIVKKEVHAHQIEYDVSTQGPRGGHGIQILEIQNQCLLSKWLSKLINEEGLWQTILQNKYLSSQTIGKVDRKSGDSHFWAGVMKYKETFLRHGSFHLNNRKQIRF
jgi:hypothetical protein